MPGKEQWPAARAGAAGTSATGTSAAGTSAAGTSAAGGTGAAAGAGASECERAQPGGPSARERILEAAERLFSERGFDRTSTARIATAAGVPHGLIFYYFKTKMDLLLAVVRDSEAVMMDDLAALPRERADLRQAVAEIWQQLSAALGKPSPVRRIIFSELAAHPEVRQRALALQDQVSAIVSQHLARASGHEEALPEHETAARLLTIAAGMVPLLDESGDTRMAPGTVAALIADGIRGAVNSTA